MTANTPTRDARKQKSRPTWLRGSELLQYSRDPGRLQAFLQHHQARLGGGAPQLEKSIVVLPQIQGASIGSNLQVAAGPMIERSGIFAPSMHVTALASYGSPVTTDPNEQRIGCDHISLQLAVRHVVEMLVAFLKFVPNAPEATQPVKSEFYSCGEVYLNAVSIDNERTAKQRVLLELLDRIETHVLQKSAEDRCEAILDLEANDAFAASTLYKLFCLKVCLPLEEDTFRRFFSAAWKRLGKIAFPPRDGWNPNAANRALITFLAAGLSSIHLERHRKAFPAPRCESIVFQGCGDVTMNAWHVAVRPPVGRDRVGRLIHVKDEDLESRQYSCLIAFKARKEIAATPDELVRAGRLGLGRVEFSRDQTDAHLVQLITRKESIPIGDEVHYVVYGQQLASGGKVVSAEEIVHEFSDVRHLIDMPNLNGPKDKQASSKAIERFYRDCMNRDFDGRQFFQRDEQRLLEVFGPKPRDFFGVAASHDVWLGERAFLRDPHMLRVACEHRLEIPLSELGAPLDWITVTMVDWGYQLKDRRNEVHERGDFAWNVINPTNPKLVWYPLPAHYPATLVGIGKIGKESKERPAFYALAWGHGFREDQRYSIFESAQILCDLGAQSVLLMDEGRDVFQYCFQDLDEYQQYLCGEKSSEQITPVSNNSREQIRGSLTFWIEDAPDA